MLSFIFFGFALLFLVFANIFWRAARNPRNIVYQYEDRAAAITALGLMILCLISAIVLL